MCAVVIVSMLINVLVTIFNSALVNIIDFSGIMLDDNCIGSRSSRCVQQQNSISSCSPKIVNISVVFGNGRRLIVVQVVLESLLPFSGSMEQNSNYYRHKMLTADMSGFCFSGTVTINVLDRDDNPPVFSKNTVTVFVNENAVTGTPINMPQILVSDADQVLHSVIDLSLLSHTFSYRCTELPRSFDPR